MADAEKSLVFVLRANITDFNKKLGDAERQFKKSFGNIQADLKSTAIQSTALAAAIMVPIATAFKSFAQQGEDIANMADKTGLTTNEVQQLGYAAKVSGSDMSGLDISIKKMQRTLVDARTGGKAAQDAFKQLGLSWDDLSKMSVGDQFKAIGDALGKVEDEATRTDLAVTIFGKNGTTMLPMFIEGVSKLSDAFDKLGGGMSDADLEKAKAAQRAIENLETAWGQLLNTLTGAATGKQGAEFITSLTEALVGMNKWAKENPQVVNAIGQIVIGIAALAGARGIVAGIGWALMPLIKAFTWLGTFLPGLGTMIAGVFGGTALVTIGAFLAAIGGVGFFVYELVTNWDKLGQLFCIVGDIIRNNLNIAINQARLAFMQARDGIVNAWNTVVGFFTGVVEGIKNAFIAVGNWLTQPFRDAWAQIQQFCNDIRNSWNNLFSSGSSATVTVTAGISRTAMGGIVTSPQIRLVGESGPEAIVPLSQMGGMGGSTININVGNYMGDELSKRALVRDLQRIMNEETRRSVHKPSETSFYSVGGHL